MRNSARYWILLVLGEMGCGACGSWNWRVGVHQRTFGMSRAWRGESLLIRRATTVSIRKPPNDRPRRLTGKHPDVVPDRCRCRPVPSESVTRRDWRISPDDLLPTSP